MAPRRLTGYLAVRLAGAVPLLLGVTLLSFTLTVYFGPDPVYTLLGRNPSPSEIEQLQQQLGQDRPFVQRYVSYLARLLTLDLGHSETSGEPVRTLLWRTLPVSLILLTPGFVLGLGLALVLAMTAAWHRYSCLDRAITHLSSFGMSLSFVIIILVCQAVFGVGLGWFPVYGWEVSGPLSYLHHVSLPTLAMVLANLGYNVRFFRAVMVEALSAAPVRTARALGFGARQIMVHYVLRAALLPIVTRVVYAVPLLIVSGSLLIESHFGIPGIGRITYNAILSGDQPVLMAVLGLASVLFVLALTLVDGLSRLIDPRLVPR